MLKCQYTRIERVEDITQCDLLGIGYIDRLEHKTQNGKALVLANAKKRKKYNRIFKLKISLWQDIY